MVSTAASTTVCYSDKSYSLSGIFLCPSSGNSRSINIVAQMVELNIFEDLFANCLSGELVIGDALDVISSLPLTGFDFINFRYSKAGGIDRTETYRVFSVTKRSPNEVNQTGQVYSLGFASEELLLSASHSISKSYRGQSVTSITKDILSHMKVPKNKMGQFDQTQGTFNIIMPNFSPFRAIHMAVQRSIPAALFYQDRNGYNLRLINNLVQQSPVGVYRYEPQNVTTTTQSLNDAINRVIDYDFVRSFDALKGYSNGLWASRLMTFDLTRWKMSIFDHSYDDFFNKTKHLDVGSFDPGLKDRMGVATSDHHSARTRVYPTTIGHDTDPYISSHDPGSKPNLVEQWFNQRQCLMEQFHWHKVKLVLPGNTMLTVGNVITFGFPVLGPKFRETNNLNPYYTGNYLVTAVRHKMTPYSYEMIVEIAKDSWGHVLPPANNTDATLSEMKGS